MRLRTGFGAALCGLLLALASPTRAADDEEIAKQKETIAANVKKIELPKVAVQETADFFVVSALPDARAKQLGEALQKAYALSVKALKFEGEERPWKGKLAVYVFPDKDNYRSFVRLVEQRRPESDETSSVSVRSETPHIALFTTKGEATGAIEAEAAAQVAAAVLGRKAGATAKLPAWFQEGFGKIVQLRGDPKAFGAYRAKVRPLLYEAKGKPSAVKLKDVWENPDVRERPLVAASLLEYLVFGPGAEKFPMLLGGFRPGEGNLEPNMPAAIKAAGMNADNLERAWKKWIVTGK